MFSLLAGVAAAHTFIGGFAGVGHGGGLHADAVQRAMVVFLVVLAGSDAAMDALMTVFGLIHK